jgi:hypothetical protein
MYNVGFQVSGFARETKTTRPGGGGGSLSTLYLNAATSTDARLRVCRLAGVFHFFCAEPASAALTEEAYTVSSLADCTTELPPAS